MGRLTSMNTKVSNLKDHEVDTMFELFKTYYDNAFKEKFLKDLVRKDRVILLKDKKTKKIKGFSTIKFVSVVINNKKINGLFSGDTIIDSNYRGQTALTMEFFKVLVTFKLKNPFNEFYWFLISKGYKTYLLLTNNFYNYYPRYDKPNSFKANKILDTFGNELFGELYNSNTGVLICENKFDRLKSNTAPIIEKHLANPNIKFFAEKNKDWAKGNELCCIGRVDIALAWKYLTRTFGKRFKSTLFSAPQGSESKS